jgi:hypothetical protein
MTSFMGSLVPGGYGGSGAEVNPAPVTPVEVGSLAERCGDGVCVWVPGRDRSWRLKYRWAKCREWGAVPVVRPVP